MIIYLTKVPLWDILFLVEANCHPFFGLADEADALTAFRKSLLMLASNFLVGTAFNASLFFFASTVHILHEIGIQLQAQLNRVLRVLLVILDAVQQFMHKHMVWTANCPEPSFATVGASERETIVFGDRNEHSRFATRTFEFKTCDVAHFDYKSVFGGHFVSGVIQ